MAIDFNKGMRPNLYELMVNQTFKSYIIDGKEIGTFLTQTLPSEIKNVQAGFIAVPTSIDVGFVNIGDTLTQYGGEDSLLLVNSSEVKDIPLNIKYFAIPENKNENSYGWIYIELSYPSIEYFYCAKLIISDNNVKDVRDSLY